MKLKNELQKAINLALQNVKSIISNVGILQGVSTITHEYIMILESDKLSLANQLASQFYGEYNINFIQKEAEILLQITSKNGAYFIKADTESIEIIQKQINKAWGQLLPTQHKVIETKQPVKIEVKQQKETFRPKMKVISIKKKEPQKKVTIIKELKPKNYFKNYYLYKGQKYYYTNKFIYR